MSNVYSVDTSNKYSIGIETIKNIEEAGDDFVTYEELCEMTGQDPSYQHHHFGTQTVKKDLVTNELLMWKQKIIDSGKKTIIITDQDLLDLFMTGAASYSSVSDYVKGLRRVGARLSIHSTEEKVKTTPTKRHHGQLVNLVLSNVNKGKKFDVMLRYANHDYEGSMIIIKKLIEWDKIDFAIHGPHHKVSDNEIALMKQIWDNPAIFNEKAVSPT